MTDRERLIRDALAAGLTPRQAEALMWQSEGCTVYETAIRMGIQHWTVTNHLAAARKRLGASSTTELLARIAYPKAA